MLRESEDLHVVWRALTRVGVAGAAAIAIAACGSGAGQAAPAVRVDRDGSGQAVPMMVLRFGPLGASFVRLTIHGRAYVFKVDTGAAHTVITNSAAAALGLRKRGRPFAVSVVGCKAASQAVSVSRWMLGGVRLAPMTIVSQALYAGPDVDGMKVSGLLGPDVLQRFGAVSFDFTSRQLVLGGSPGAGRSIPIRVNRLRGSTSFETVRAVIKGKPANWLIDTGATGAVVSQRAATELGLAPVGRTVLIRGASGCTVPGTPVALKSWSAGGVSLPPTLALASPSALARKVDGMRVDGSVGFATFLAFKRVTLDFATRRLILGRPA